MNFVHLHTHSEYSLLDGACTIDKLLGAAGEHEMRALALTDHGNMFGALQFYEKALKAGIKPIVGYEAYVAPGSRFSKERKTVSGASYHLSLLVKNIKGYRNLLKLASTAYMEGFYYKPRIDKEILAQHSEGLIGLSGCLKGESAYRIVSGDQEGAKRCAGEYAEIFGPENFYIEVMKNGLADQKTANGGLLEIARDLDLPLVATNDIHYLAADDARAHDILLCISTGKLLSDEKRMRFGTPEFYFRSAEEMKVLFKDIPDAVTNTLAIAERCNLELDFKETHNPKYHDEDGVPSVDLLRKLCEEGLKRRYPDEPEEARKRLEFEFSVVKKEGFIDYMLLIWDVVRFARESGISVGPGRGSAAGCLISYLLNITDIDPLEFGLLFERFLNPDRVSPPDIDIDFCKERREEVLSYVREKYGSENVAQIITFGRMKARAVIRDVGRVLDISLGDIDQIAKKIPGDPNISLKEALEQTPELSDQYDTEVRIQDLFDVAMKLEGLARHASTHAAGVVLADAPLTEYVPLYKSTEGATTQYAMKDLVKAGLFKMDFLGLKTLTVIDKAVRLIKDTTGDSVDVDSLPLDDETTYRMLSAGKTQGVFQLESSGMTELVMKLKPSCIDDMIAAVALYRPGPLGSGMIEDFTSRKRGQASVNYDHPSLEPILKETHGVIVYQEQVMKIANVLAGFSMGQADSLRQAMSKKEDMEGYRQEFMEGAAKNKVDHAAAAKVYELLSFFGGYGFNKSHAAAYAIIAYRTAYLKAHYPTQYMAALMSADMSDTDKIIECMDECRHLDIKILPPDVNDSFSRFTVVETGKIRFGLAAVKNVGARAVEAITAAREEHGRFISIFDFCNFVDLKAVNKQVVESMIKCGAFDSLGARRAQLIAIMPEAFRMGSRRQKDRERGQSTFFDIFEEDEKEDEELMLPDAEEWPEGQMLAYEKEFLGFYVSSHPLTRYEKLLGRYSTCESRKLSELEDGQRVVLGGIIIDVRTTTTKKGDAMAFGKVEDLEGVCRFVAFPEAFEKWKELLLSDEVVFLKGRADTRQDEPSIVVSSVVKIADAHQELAGSVTVRIPSTMASDELLYSLKDIFDAHPGSCPVILEMREENNNWVGMRVGAENHIAPSERFAEEVGALVGDEHVVFTPHGNGKDIKPRWTGPRS